MNHRRMLPKLWRQQIQASSWTGLFLWNMLLVMMMMIKEMGTVLTGGAVICLLREEAMIVGDLQVHTAEIGEALIMAMVPE